jgi:hypothetical protein
MFTSNINSIDKVLRIILGLGMLLLTITGPQTAWGYVGIVFIVTAFINFCPVYALFGFSTRSKTSS